MKTNSSTHFSLAIATAVLAFACASGAAAQGTSSPSTSSLSPADARRAACLGRWKAEKQRAQEAAQEALKAQAEGKELTLADKAAIERAQHFPSSFVACN